MLDAPLQSTLVWATIAYLVAAIPMGLAMGKVRGVDLRGVGSGNIGATNAVRALGKKLGLVVFALDVAKAALPVWVASMPINLGATPDASQAISIVAMAAFCGHVYPVYLRFRGGKGVACALGVFLVLSPASALAGLVLYVQTLVLTGISGVASLTGATGMLLFVLTQSPDPMIAGLVVVMNAIIWWRHRSNLKELFAKRKADKAQKLKDTEANSPS